METKRPLPIPVTACRCGRQPQRVHVIAGDRYYIECSACDIRTGRYRVLDFAVDDWELMATRTPAITD
jgi:hypothetical protein